MATINRAPWTALVDDDGSNTVGTIWNKDKIKTVLLDPIDAALALVPSSGVWVTPPFNAADYFVSIGTGTWTIAAGDVLTCAYTILGKLLFWELALNPTAPIGSGIVGLSRKPMSAHQIAHVSVGMFLMSPNTVGYYQLATGVNSQINLFRDIVGTAWVGGSVPPIRASGFYEIV